MVAGARRQGFRSHRNGMTLLEVLIALVVLGMFLVPAMLAVSQAVITSNESSIAVVASSIARQRLESLKLLSYDSIQSSPERSSADLRPGDRYFQVATTVTETQPNGPNLDGVKEVVVTVYQAGSQSPLVVLTTRVTPVGV